ncbi:MAG: integrase arm-type DNA-binding domain-containing protein, partial [Gammaproteobacteria bacterium]|nr:integrase arm-type DNA-binding domain-containing protein [Gammaproteobacteria bacterium]
MTRQSTTGKLAAVTVRQSKPRDKPYKLSDGGGMYLLINPNGSRYWRWKYRINQKEKVLALGVYPNVSMTDAREKVQEAKQILDKGIDPGTHKKHIRASSKHESFKPIAEEWLQKESGRWSKGHAEKVWRTIKADALPYLGNMSIK